MASAKLVENNGAKIKYATAKKLPAGWLRLMLSQFALESLAKIDQVLASVTFHSYSRK